MSLDTLQQVSQAKSLLRNETVKSKGEDDKLNKQDFMNLFLTQMSNQNPVDPMDSGGMMTQLAQLGSMEQLENINKELQTMNGTQKNLASFGALTFLEKDVMTESTEVELAQGSGKPVFYSLDQSTNDLKVVIEAKDGSPVFQENLGHAAIGKHKFVWNGKNNEGVLMPEGKYNIRFSALQPDGSLNNIALLNKGKVLQVDYRDGETWIKTHNNYIPLSKVKSVDNSSEKTFGRATPLPLKTELPIKKMMEIQN